MKSYAIILGGGSGRRMEADRNKVFLPLRGIPAIVRAIAPFSALCAGAVVVAAAAEVEEMRAVIARCGLDRFVMRVVPGGAERQDSVRCGLDALPDDAECVLIHDGARALVTEDVIRRAIESVESARLGHRVGARDRHHQARRARRAGAGYPRPICPSRHADPAGLPGGADP